MKSVLNLTAVGAVCYVIALAATLPAEVAAPYLPEYVHVENPSGTLWRGRAARLRVENFDLGNARWTAQPLALLSGRWQARIEFEKAGLQGNSRFGTGFGPLRLEDTTVRGNATMLAPLIDTFGFDDSITGRMELNLQSVALQDGWLQDLAGELHWRDARLTVPREVELGDIAVEFGQNSNTTVAEMRNRDGVVDLQGEARLEPGGGYEARLRVAPNDRTPDEVLRALRYMGKPDAQGAVTLTQQGTLNLPPTEGG